MFTYGGIERREQAPPLTEMGSNRGPRAAANVIRVLLWRANPVAVVYVGGEPQV